MEFIFSVILAFVTAFVLGTLYRRWREKRALGHPLQLAKSKRLMVDGVQIHYIQEGRGHDLLLVHGIGASKFCWRLIFQKLTANYRVTAIDLPGFGDSEKNPDLDYGLDAQTDRLAAFVEKLHLNPVHVVGCSMGGAIGLWLAKSYPNLVEKLCVIAPAADHRIVWFNTGRALGFVKFFGKSLTSRYLIEKAYKRVVEKPEHFTKEVIDEYYRPYEKDKNAPTTFWKAQETLRDKRLPDALKVLKTPTLVLYGEKDKQVKRRNIDHLMQAVSHARLALHPKGGHHLMEDEPDFVLNEIESFFNTTKEM